MAARFLPMSCMSPSTVPMTTVPSVPPPSPSLGLMRSRQACMVRALSSTSGMNFSPLFISAPTTSMPGSSALSRISRAAAPSSRSGCVAAVAPSSPAMIIFLRDSKSAIGSFVLHVVGSLRSPRLSGDSRVLLTLRDDRPDLRPRRRSAGLRPCGPPRAPWPSRCSECTGRCRRPCPTPRGRDGR